MKLNQMKPASFSHNEQNEQPEKRAVFLYLIVENGVFNFRDL